MSLCIHETIEENEKSLEAPPGEENKVDYPTEHSPGMDHDKTLKPNNGISIPDELLENHKDRDPDVDIVKKSH